MKNCKVENKKLINRISRIEGQVKALKTKLEQEEECGQKDPFEVIRQLSAIKGAVNGMIHSYIEHYAKDHIIKEIKKSDDKLQAIKVMESLLDILKSFNK